MMRDAPVRLLGFVFLALALQAAPAGARSDPRDWVSTVVTKISAADLGEAGEGGGTVTIRVRIAADGSLDAVSIDEGSGSEATDQRAIQAVRAASPFRPPPKKLLGLEGYTELAFPLELGGKRAR